MARIEFQEFVMSTDLEEEDSSLGGRVIVLDSESPKSTMSQFDSHDDDKAKEIRDCLHHNRHVDLWELRQLALSPGGLMLPALRQMAWPLLTGLSVEASSNSEASLLSEENSALEVSIQKDLSSVVWNVEDLVRASKSGNENFWCVSHQQQQQHAMEGSADAPTLVYTTACSATEGSQDTVDGSTVATKECYTISEKDKVLIAKVLTEALQGQSHENFPPMLSNLAAVLLINLDLSTTMASQVLSRLVSYHLGAAFSGASMTEVLSICIDKLQLKTKENCKVTAGHAATWFSGIEAHHFNVQTASRLIDAFLASHPLFPIYFAAAISEEEPWTMDHVEAWLGVGLDYMHHCPPAELLAAVDASLNLSSPPSWALAATAPPVVVNQPGVSVVAKHLTKPWSDDDSDDSSEWEHLSKAEDDAEEGPIPEQQILFFDSYPLAIRAAGLTEISARAVSKKGGGNGFGSLVQFLFWAAIVAGLAMILNDPGRAAPSVTTPKAVSPIPQLPLPTKIPKSMAQASNKIPVSNTQVSTVVRANETTVASYAPKPTPKLDAPKPSPKLVPPPVLSKLSVVVRSDDAIKMPTLNTSISGTPASVELVQKFLPVGYIRSMAIAPSVEFAVDSNREVVHVAPAKPASMAVTKDPKFKPLQAIVKKVSKVWGNVRRGVKEARMIVTWTVISFMHLMKPSTHIGK